MPLRQRKINLSNLIFHSEQRTKGNLRWETVANLKAIFRLWLESGWRHALVGAELGKFLLTVFGSKFLLMNRRGEGVWGK